MFSSSFNVGYLLQWDLIQVSLVLFKHLHFYFIYIIINFFLNIGNPRIEPFYQKLKEHGIVLLSHG
jgi:hypothetical protein